MEKTYRRSNDAITSAHPSIHLPLKSRFKFSVTSFEVNYFHKETDISLIKRTQAFFSWSFMEKTLRLVRRMRREAVTVCQLQLRLCGCVSQPTWKSDRLPFSKISPFPMKDVAPLDQEVAVKSLQSENKKQQPWSMLIHVSSHRLYWWQLFTAEKGHRQTYARHKPFARERNSFFFLPI